MPALKEMFSDSQTSKDRAEKHELFVAAINKSCADAAAGRTKAVPTADGAMKMHNADTRVAQVMADIADITKSVDPSVLASLQSELSADIVKDISLTSPLNTGFVAYDLEAPAKLLVPLLTPYRNSLPRKKAIGVAHQFKRITGLSNAGVGGVGNLHAGIADTTQTDFANPSSAQHLYYNRGAKITWAADEKKQGYQQFSLSDELSWSTQFSMEGYQDGRALSAMGVLWASLLFEEKESLLGRGTDSTLPFAGALADPQVAGTLTVAARAAGAGEVGNSANIANLYITVTAENAFGESLWTANITSTALSAATGDVLDVKLTADTSGAQGYRIYAGTTNTRAGVFFNGRTGFSSTSTGAGVAMFTIQFTGAGTGGAINAGVNPPVADTSAYANGYDGLLTYCDSANSGYRSRINGKWSTSVPGSEIQTALKTMYNLNRANPEEILISATDRGSLSDTIRSGTSGSSTAYKINLDMDQASGVTVGDIVTGIYNQATGRPVDLTVQPWMPQGNLAIVSKSIPYPNSNIDSVMSFLDVQPYMGIQWPQLQFSYDFSSYWYGSLMCQAPAFLGYIGGIQAE